MVTDPKSRLASWSERKLASRAPAPAPVPVEAPDDASATPGEDAPVPELPDIDSLDGSSDFSAFMQQGVPEDLQRLALRKLWTSDPVYANLDGLNDYDPEHVTFLVQAAEAAKEVLKKVLDGDGEPAAEAPAETPVSEAAPEPAPAPEPEPETAAARPAAPTDET